MKFAYRRSATDDQVIEVDIVPVPERAGVYRITVGEHVFELAERLLHHAAFYKEAGEITLQFEGREYRLFDASQRRRPTPIGAGDLRAPMAGNVAAVLAGIVVLAILLGAAELRSACTGSFDFSLDFALGFGENGTGSDPCPHSLWLICGFGLRLARPEGRHYMLGEHVLCLHALPVLQPAKVGDDRQFTNSTFFLQRPYLLDDFFRRADEADLLIDDFVIG